MIRPPAVREAKRVLDEFNRAQRKARPKSPPKPDTVKRRKPTWGRLIDDDHRAFIRTLPCLATLIRTGREVFGVECAHVRYSDHATGARNPGMGVKPGDDLTLPASQAEHRAQHKRGDERAYWDELGVPAPHSVARALYTVTGDLEAGIAILRRAVALAQGRRRMTLPDNTPDMKREMDG